MNRKKIFAVAAALFFFTAFGLSAGGSQDSSTGGTGDKITLQLSHQLAANHSIHTTSLKFSELAKEKSGGQIDIRVYEAATLGTERENLEALRAGTLDIAFIVLEFYSSYVPEAGVLVLPFLYDGYDHLNKVLQGAIGQKMTAMILDKTDVKILAFHPIGSRQIFTSKKPLNTLKDIAGMKIRVPENPLYVNTFQLLGAAPTPVAWQETYTALDTGVVEGLENTPEAVISATLYEVTKYVNITDHMIPPATFSMSNKVFQKQPVDVQNFLLTAAKEAGEFGLKLTQENDAISRKQLAEKMEFVQTDKQSFRSAIDYNKFDVMKYQGAKDIKALIDASR
jgi:tripartite ATP-independent transporter DctP family solute receptor